MHFGSPLPWWLVVLVVTGIVGLSTWSYRRPLVPLSRMRRGALVALRSLALGSVVVLICRPIVFLPPAAAGDVVVPVLVDVSRSMRVADAHGAPRIAEARHLLEQTLLPGLAGHARVELFAAAETLVPAAVDALTAEGRRSDILGAVTALRHRYRGRRVPGLVVLSDGADTGQGTLREGGAETGPPVFVIGIGSIDGAPDREVTAVAAGDPRLDQASVEVHVSAVTRGLGRGPFQVRLLSNGQLLDTRTVTPPADGSPIELAFQVSPDPRLATTYTAEIPVADGEAAVENNARSVLISPAGRKRRVLVLSGAPGYEHSFLVRTLAHDPDLEVDAVVRKGQNDTGADTFLVQAGGGRAAALTSGFPSSREALFEYDALVVTNLEGDFFTRAQLALAADFVGERGGGLLVLGGRSFEGRGLAGTPLEEVLPLEVNDRRAGRVPVLPPDGLDVPALQHQLVLTAEGQGHPIMRLGATGGDTRARWAELPPLAGSAAVGGPRPGATVLAVARTASGAVQPVVAIQRYGRGRSMVFAGEASWRWRMLRLSTDRSYEWFWRQALRWLASEAPEPVTVNARRLAEPGDGLTVDVTVRNRAFLPAADAVVDARLTAPGAEPAPLALSSEGNGRFVAVFTPQTAGVYRIHVDARRGSTTLGSDDRWVLVGGADREFADPRLNEGLLRRLARDAGGSYVRASDAARLLDDLRASAPPAPEPVRRDL